MSYGFYETPSTQLNYIGRLDPEGYARGKFWVSPLAGREANGTNGFLYGRNDENGTMTGRSEERQKLTRFHFRFDKIKLAIKLLKNDICGYKGTMWKDKTI